MIPSSPLPEISAYMRRHLHVEKVDVPRLEELPGLLRDITTELPGITGTWNPVEIYTADPKALRDERQKFLTAFARGRAYQPHLTYAYAESFQLGDSRKRLENMLKELRAFEPSTRAEKLVKLMLHYKLKDDIATCGLVEGLQEKDDRKTAAALQYKYPGVDPLVLGIAEQDWRRRATAEALKEKAKSKRLSEGALTRDERAYLENLMFDAPAIKEAFEWALERYGMLRREEGGKGFTVIVDRRATAMDVRDKSAQGPAVFIPEQSKESGETLLALMAHEIEGHARQSWNGENFFIFGGGPMKVDEETLYEGLAMRYENDFWERYYGTESIHRNLDYYVFGVKKAEEGGTFADVFADQLERRLQAAAMVHGVTAAKVKASPPDYDRALSSAWGVTYRVMRGHTDMGNPHHFAMSKDLAYFRGWLLDQQLHAFGHGHINEASICSIGQLRVLAEFNIDESHLPAPYKDVTSQYLQLLLDKRTKPGAFAAKRHL